MGGNEGEQDTGWETRFEEIVQTIHFWDKSKKIMCIKEYEFLKVIYNRNIP